MNLHGKQIDLFSRIADFFIDICFRAASYFVYKPQRSVFFLPTQNSINDKYDIINCHSDNALFLANTMILNHKFDSYIIKIVYFDKNDLDKYIEYCRPYHPERIKFVLYSDRFSFKTAFIQSRYIFTDDYYELFRYRITKQVITCLSYYPFPFKDDFYKFTKYGGYKKMIHSQKQINKVFDYHISVSDMASCLISKDSQIFYPKFLPLGFPRNDTFYSVHESKKTELLKLLSLSGYERIISYTPTHRDYESPLRIFYDKSASVTRTIWGDVTNDSLEKLDNMLEANNAIIIAKSHAVQTRTNNIKPYKSNRVFLFSEIEQIINMSLYDILALSDMLITDYTTTVFDFLHANKPVVFYCYDFCKYHSTRGFFIDPISPLCAGKITYSLDELSKEIDSIFKDGDTFSEKRKFIKELVFKHLDGYSSKRILDYFFGV